jgi:hypothetical protein
VTVKATKRRRAPAQPNLTDSAIAADRGGPATLLDDKGQLPRDLVITWLRIVEVKPYPNNPRIPGDAIADVRQSLLDFGWQQPIVVDKDYVIIVGHNRYYAALDLQQTHVPVYVAKRLTPEQVAAYRLADNKIGERSEWDFPKLAVELGSLRERGVDLVLTGFRPFEWEPLLASGWSPPAATGALGGERDNEAKNSLRFTDKQWETVQAAIEQRRVQERSPDLAEAVAVTNICNDYL